MQVYVGLTVNGLSRICELPYTALTPPMQPPTYSIPNTSIDQNKIAMLIPQTFSLIYPIRRIYSTAISRESIQARKRRPCNGAGTVELRAILDFVTPSPQKRFPLHTKFELLISFLCSSVGGHVVVAGPSHNHTTILGPVRRASYDEGG